MSRRTTRSIPAWWGIRADFFSGGAGADTNTDLNAADGDTTDGT